jgi:hypothetical protein
MDDEPEPSETSRVELRTERKNSKPDLFIGDRKTDYGQFVDGQYFLREDAYRWSNDLVELAEEHQRYRERVAVVSRMRREG